MEVCFANPGTSEMHLVAAIGQSLARALPDNAIVVDEAATCGLGIFPLTGQAAPHDWLTLTGHD
jgi:hypothetical protein